MLAKGKANYLGEVDKVSKTVSITCHSCIRVCANVIYVTGYWLGIAYTCTALRYKPDIIRTW